MLLLLLQSATSPVVVDGHLGTTALLFLVVSWACVLGLTVWSFSKILRIQAQRAATPSPADDMTARERVPPTA
jgi:hypothetical protein